MSRFAPVQSAPNSPAAPDAISQSGTEAHKERGNATSERKGRQRSGATTSPQAHKERDTPPYCNGQAAVPLITNSRQKISKKSPWVVLKKNFGKIFRGNVSGAKKNPLRCLNGRGDCFISLTNHGKCKQATWQCNNQKRTKALLNNQGQR